MHLCCDPQDNFEKTLKQLWDNFETTLSNLWNNFETTLTSIAFMRLPARHHSWQERQSGLAQSPCSKIIAIIDNFIIIAIISISLLSSSMAPLLPTTLMSPSKSPTSTKSQILLAPLYQNLHQHWHRKKCNNDDKYDNYHKYNIHHKCENRHMYNNHHRHISISLLGATFSACKLVHITASSSRPACSSSEVGL